MSLFALIRNCLCFSNTFKRLELHGYIRSQSHSEVIHTFVKVWHLSTRKFMLFGLSPTAGMKHEHSVETWKFWYLWSDFIWSVLVEHYMSIKGNFHRERKICNFPHCDIASSEIFTIFRREDADGSSPGFSKTLLAAENYYAKLFQNEGKFKKDMGLSIHHPP